MSSYDGAACLIKQLCQRSILKYMAN